MSKRITQRSDIVLTGLKKPCNNVVQSNNVVFSLYLHIISLCRHYFSDSESFRSLSEVIILMIVYYVYIYIYIYIFCQRILKHTYPHKISLTKLV